MSQLSVTATIPTYDARNFIAQTLEAPANKDVTGYKAVVSDHASTEGAGEKSERVAAGFRGLVTVLRSKKRHSLSANFSRLLVRTETDLVAFCDGDDFFLPGKIRAQQALFECRPRDASAEPFRSPLLLLDDNRLLGPAHKPQDDIRERDAGGYPHWEPSGVVFFSSSNDTDPRNNGRKYTVLIPREPQRPISATHGEH